ncbi:class C sortase [Parafannyhessea umbonata]|uniref:class C sortase n=1 Tax=Parafannyhessea umbonata TaxID=604330 RepID=UPI0026F08EA5|nr:class C sortase [Parafannyhessea umbonata]MCI6681813.1 class C sortase [Parafannyhessea umbonata]MCI7218276.1 class C sortase [Parafannyhessea umbonata]
MGKWLRAHALDLLLGCVLLFGVGLLLYPTVSDWWNNMHQSQAIATYQKAVQDNSAEKNKKMWDAAVAYNAALPHDDSRFEMTAAQRKVYEQTLDVTGTGIMGYVEIPKISVRLPIYHGTDSSILQIAIGHIPGSSLPVGGLGTHCVISGHRGLPSARLFTDIDQLREGDLFTLNVLGKTLTYQVDQIRVVLPNQLDDLAIDDGLDLCTLVTCTPYGVNTHRLLVRGHRVPNRSAALAAGDTSRVSPVLVAVLATVLVAAVAALVRLAIGRRRAHGLADGAGAAAQAGEKDKRSTVGKGAQR